MKTKRTRAEVDAILAFYQQKHTMIETCKAFNLTKNQLAYLVKRESVSNGRTLSEINKEKSKAAASASIRRAENNLAVELLTHGFGYLNGYEHKGSRITVVHFECGGTFSRRSEWFKANGFKCPICEAAKAEAEKAEAQRRKDIEREERQKEKERRALLNPLGLSPYQLEREKRLDEVHTCKICGNNYTLREYMARTGHKYAQNAGYCSAGCAKEGTRQRERLYRRKTGHDNGNSRRRARLFGCEYSGHKITWQRLAKRKGLKNNELFCALCGCLCDPNDHTWSKSTGPTHPSIDHIVPMRKGGGDTWENVQIACMACNSKKGARYE